MSEDTQPRRHHRRLTDIEKQFFSQFDWDVWVTFTSARALPYVAPVGKSEQNSWRYHLRRYLGGLASTHYKSCLPCAIAYNGEEPTHSVHVLVKFVKPPTTPKTVYDFRSWIQDKNNKPIRRSMGLGGKTVVIPKHKAQSEASVTQYHFSHLEWDFVSYCSRKPRSCKRQGCCSYHISTCLPE
jgi:hypothetical protein